MRDEPTDGIFNDSTYLAEALDALGRPTTIIDLGWTKVGIRRALADLPGRLPNQRPLWVILQFTPLAWGPRGFPIAAMRTVSHLRKLGVKVGISFHDAFPTEGARLYDRCRRAVQVRIMRRMVRHADHSFFHVTPEHGAPWLRDTSRTSWLPTGTAIPQGEPREDADERFTVGIFCLSDSDKHSEVADVIDVMRRVAVVVGNIRLLAFGRGTARAEPLLREQLSSTSIEIEVHGGIVPESEVGRCLARTDALLFVRNGLSTRRSTFVAALAYGLPIVGYANAETGWPIRDAGVMIIESGDTAGAAEGLLALAKNESLLASMRVKSEELFAHFFAWERIAERLAEQAR